MSIMHMMSAGQRWCTIEWHALLCDEQQANGRWAWLELERGDSVVEVVDCRVDHVLQSFVLFTSHVLNTHVTPVNKPVTSSVYNPN